MVGGWLDFRVVRGRCMQGKTLVLHGLEGGREDADDAVGCGSARTSAIEHRNNLISSLHGAD